MEDLFDLLDSDEKPFAQKEVVSTAMRGNDDKVNLWESLDIKPVKIDISKLHKFKKTFGISTYVPNGNVPADIKEKIVEIAKILATKGYTFRHNGGTDDAVQNAVLEIENIKTESYLPWKKFNINIKNPFLIKLTETGYGIAANSHKVFFKLPPAVRAVLAKDVHTMLGANCMEPLDLIIAYTECGSEAITKNMDFKKSGNVTFTLKVAGDSNIPVFNLKNENAVKHLVEHIRATNQVASHE